MLESFLQAVRDDPHDTLTWQVLADWFEENDQAPRAELVRLRQDLLHDPVDPERQAKEKRLRELLLSGVAPVVPLWAVDLPGGVSLPLALIPAGRFLMGSPASERFRHGDEGPRHRVRISQPFYLGIHPVTQRQWQALMGNNPSTFVGEQRPVESVNWAEARSFCDRLGEQIRRTCRLPTEAEWEYACRACTTTSFFTGEGARAIRLAGWCSYRGDSGSAGQTRPAGEYLANAFGLHDMHGNVREWCEDDLRVYTRRGRVDPRGALDGDYRVVRGGSWYYSAEDSRSASRYRRPVSYRLDYYGFRVLVVA